VLALVNNEAHPFILGLRYAFHTPAKLYYVLNFCNGGDLYYLLSRCKKFKEAQARFYASEVFLALQHLHKLGVIYRDLKPENVLLDSDGHVKLTDFGLSKEAPTADTFCGTPVYLAPEIWMRKTYGFEVDWWSLGCVLYEMVCGLPPFWGDTIKDVYKKVINSTPKFPAMSPECQAVIEGLLQREPAARLGGREHGVDIKEHEFFKPVAWADLLEKKVKPPFKSKSASQEDTNNFHKAFTNQKPTDSMSNATVNPRRAPTILASPPPHLRLTSAPLRLSQVINDEQQAEFEGFTYIPEAAGLSISDQTEADGRKSQYTQPRAST
jgi:serine/threonine protein kinase